MNCCDCKKEINKRNREVWFYDLDGVFPETLYLCEDCFIERASKDYNKYLNDDGSIKK